MRSRWIILIAAAALGILAAALAGRYLAAVRSQALAGAKPVEVLVAKEDIPKGLTADEIRAQGLTETRKVPQQYLSASAISTMKAVDGQVLAVSLGKGEQLTTNRFQFSSQAGLSFGVPKGMVALSLASDEVRGIAGLVKTGDNVVVIASVKTDANDENSWKTRVLVDGARVLATGHTTGVEAKSAKSADQGVAFAAKADDKQVVPSSITLALSPDQMERVVLAQEVGRVWLALLPTEEKALVVKTSGQVRATVLK
ncbi:MAG TPA: Flp pilus assembly protein CpaB [Coriobacteriia bacterium]|jgi:Flp pilus assembly protein CpaB